LKTFTTRKNADTLSGLNGVNRRTIALDCDRGLKLFTQAIPFLNQFAILVLTTLEDFAKPLVFELQSLAIVCKLVDAEAVFAQFVGKIPGLVLADFLQFLQFLNFLGQSSYLLTIGLAAADSEPFMFRNGITKATALTPSPS
jgi:hypothetical protein